MKDIANGTRTCLSKINEILDILQEECAEVIQAISKCRRFGMDNVYIKGSGTQREHLVQELGDVRLLIELLKSQELFNEAEIHQAELNKSKKLVIYSKIYED